MNQIKDLKNIKVISRSIRLVLVLDILLTGVSFMGSYYICSFIYPGLTRESMLIQLPLIIAISSLIFILIGSYKGFVKHDRIKEVYDIFNAICLANILTIVFVVINVETFMVSDFQVPVSIIVVHSILSFFALVVARYLYKILFYKYFIQNNNISEILVVGRGSDLGKNVEALKNYLKDNDYSFKGYIDIDNSCSEKEFNIPIKIFTKHEITSQFLENNFISKLIIAQPKIATKDFDGIINYFSNFNVLIEGVHLKNVETIPNETLEIDRIELIGHKYIKSSHDESVIHDKSTSRSSSPITGKVVLFYGNNVSREIKLEEVYKKIRSIRELILVSNSEEFLKLVELKLKPIGLNYSPRIIINESDIFNEHDLLANYQPDVMINLDSKKVINVAKQEQNILNKRLANFSFLHNDLTLKKSS